MNQKHFTFDFDYFPMQATNIFQSIKIQLKNKNKVTPKGGIKRFSFKNQLNLQDLPQLYYFQKSNCKAKPTSSIQKIIYNEHNKQNVNESSQNTWSFQKHINGVFQNNERVQSCPKVYQIYKDKKNSSPHNKFNELNCFIQKQKSQLNCQIQNLKSNNHDKKSNITSDNHLLKLNLTDYNNVLKQKVKNDNNVLKQKIQLIQNLKQSKSQYSQCESSIQIPQLPSTIYNLRANKKDISNKDPKVKQYEKQSLKKQIGLKQNNPTKSISPSTNNPQTLPSKPAKNNSKLCSSLLMQQNSKITQKKFISLNKRSYYIPQKTKSTKKNKNINTKSTRDQCNVIVVNDPPKQSSQDCYNHLLGTDTVIDKNKQKTNHTKQNTHLLRKNKSNYRPSDNYKLQSNDTNKVQSNQPNNVQKINSHNVKSSHSHNLQQDNLNNIKQSNSNYTQHNKSSKKSSSIKFQYFDIIKKTGQVLNKYKGQCSELQKQKDQYEQKYNQAIRKLNRIKQQLEIDTPIQ